MAHDPLEWVHEEWTRWQAQGLTRECLTREGPQSGFSIQIAGRQLLNFGSNDYLGLAADERLIAAARDSLDRAGFGAGASPLVTGRGSLHAELEEALAAFEGCERTLLFPTGFAANAGTIPELVSRGDIVFSDAKNHASIVDGCRLSGAKVVVYRHVDMQHLADQLQEHRPVPGRKLIVTDGLFSMDGDLAPLPTIVELAEQAGAMVLVDEAHATGVFGEQGRGICEHFGVEERVTLRVGTLSKALGSAGGFVAGPAKLVEWLRNRARTYAFSTAMPEVLSAAVLAALEVVRTEPQRRVSLLQSAATLRSNLQRWGLDVGSSQSQIVPVLLGEASRTMEVAGQLREAGYFVPGIRPPSVPPGESLLRISLTVDHSPTDLESLATMLSNLLLPG